MAQDPREGQPNIPEPPKGVDPNEEVLEIVIVRKLKRLKLIGDDGNKRDYILKELMGSGRDTIANNESSKWRTNEKGEVVGRKDYTGTMSGLIAACLFDEANKPVSEMQIQQWPTTAQEVLFEECQKLNAMGKYSKEAQEKAKKDLEEKEKYGTGSHDASGVPYKRRKDD
jgi:single-stranded DNA-specific DHH superfamily exonuclease